MGKAHPTDDRTIEAHIIIPVLKMTGLAPLFLTALRAENSSNKKNAQASLAFFLLELFIRDRGRVKTYNLIN